jgi:hypothetical protein
VQVVELIGLPLALLAPRGGGDHAVLAPSSEQAPGLVALLQAHGLSLQSAPRTAVDWTGWLALLVPGGPRLPVPGPLAGELHASLPLALEAPRTDGELREKLWLLLPEELGERGVEERILEGLRRCPPGPRER